MQTNYFKVMVPKEEARFGTLPATPWNFTGHLGTLQATLSNVNFQLTRFGTSPVFPHIGRFCVSRVRDFTILLSSRFWEFFSPPPSSPIMPSALSGATALSGILVPAVFFF